MTGCRRLEVLLGLAAMVPLGLNPSLQANRGSLLVPLCTGAGPGGAIALPLGPARLPGDDRDHCRDKACHGAGSRKRLSGGFDPAQ